MLRRLLPDAADLTPEAVVSGLALGDRAPSRRPYVVCNMVATADGRATVRGRSGPIGNDADHEIFHGLRTQTDAIMAGTGTLRVERYGPLVRDPALRERRVSEGLRPIPLACVISRSLRVPMDIPLFADPESTVVVYTPVDDLLPPCPATVEVTRLPAQAFTLLAALERLRADHNVRSVLCEGGPTILGALLAEGLVDELFLTVAPKLAGGHGISTVEGPALAAPQELKLASALEGEGYLFLRYVLQRPL